MNTFYYPNMQGGAEQSVKLLAEGMVKNGYEVAVYCIDSKNGNQEEEYNGVKVYRCTGNDFHLYRFTYDKKNVGKLEKIQQKLLTRWNRKCCRDFQEICEKFQPDIVHSNSVYGMSYLIWKEAYKRGIPVVHTIRDRAIVSPVQYGHKVNRLVLKAHRLYMRYFTKFVSGVTAPSEYTLRTSLETGCFKHAVLKQCIFNSVKFEKSDLHHLMEEKKLRNSPHIKFMYAGRLVQHKGIAHMLDAFWKMQNKDCELYICGGGEMAELVRQAAEKDSRIIYCGKLNNEELEKKYKECDVLLVPSQWPEPFGRVVIEGNMYGMPVIAGRCGGIPEIIENTHGGKLYTAGSADELAEQMDRFTDRAVFQAYFDSIEKTIDIYGINHQLKRFEEVYRALV